MAPFAIWNASNVKSGALTLATSASVLATRSAAAAARSSVVERDVGLAAVGVGGRRPQVLLDPVPAGPGLALLEVRLAGVEQGVEVAERLRDGLDPLPVDARLRVQVARRVVVARGIRVGERLGARDERPGLVLDVGDVRVLRVLELLGDVTRRADRRARVGHGEGGLDPVADHARLARRVVRARPDLHDEVAGEARADVLDLGHDPQLVLAQEVELGHVVARVLDLERERPGRRRGRRQLALGRGRLHVDGRRAGAGRVRDAAGEHGQHDDRGGDRGARGAGAWGRGASGLLAAGGRAAAGAACQAIRRTGCRPARAPATGSRARAAGRRPTPSARTGTWSARRRRPRRWPRATSSRARS